MLHRIEFITNAIATLCFGRLLFLSSKISYLLHAGGCCTSAESIHCAIQCVSADMIKCAKWPPIIALSSMMYTLENRMYDILSQKLLHYHFSAARVILFSVVSVCVLVCPDVCLDVCEHDNS